MCSFMSRIVYTLNHCAHYFLLIRLSLAKLPMRTKSNFTIEPADQTDAELLAAIHKECFPTYWNPDEFNNFFGVEGTHAFLVIKGETPVGMMVYRAQFEQADIITIAVLPEHRKLGIARAMLEKSLAHMTKLGVETIFLDVEDGNQAAISLYEGYGFAYQRRRKLYYRQKDGSYTDALVMQKKIA